MSVLCSFAPTARHRNKGEGNHRKMDGLLSMSDNCPVASAAAVAPAPLPIADGSILGIHGSISIFLFLAVD